MAGDSQFHEKLYRAFRTFFDDAEQERRWNPYRDVPWDQINPDIPEEVAVCAETFLGVEAFLPDYLRGGLDIMRQSSLGQRWFTANWGYEELKHQVVLTEYLIRSGKRTEEQMFDYQAELMKQTWQRPFDTARRMTIYGALQEKATFVIYLRHEKVAKRYGDAALATAYRLAARDECQHAKFYQDVVRVYLEEDWQGTVADLAHVARNFQMPGVGIVPNYDSRIQIMRNEGGMSRDVFLQKVFFPVLKYVGVSRSDLVTARRAEQAALAAAETPSAAE